MTDHHVPDVDSKRDQAEHSQQFIYDIGDDELPSEAVIRAVAAVTDTSVLDLKPLYEVIDPDHLDSTLDEIGTTVSTTLSFRYHGCMATVMHDEVRFV